MTTAEPAATEAPDKPESAQHRGAIRNYLSRLRHPYLFLIAGLVFTGDLLVPDLIPLADEIVLGAFTVLFGALKEKRRQS